MQIYFFVIPVGATVAVQVRVPRSCSPVLRRADTAPALLGPASVFRYPVRSDMSTSAMGFPLCPGWFGCDTTTGGFTITLPGGTSAAVVGVLDAGPFFSTNNLIVAPASGQFIDTGAPNDTITFDQNRQNCIFYRANGSNTWEIQSSSNVAYAPGFTPGQVNGATIAAGNIGETIVTLTAGNTAISNTIVSIQSQLVQPGVYMAYGHASLSAVGAGANTITDYRMELSTSNGGSYVDNETASYASDSTGVLSGKRMNTGPLYVNISVATTFYLNASTANNSGTVPTSYNASNRQIRFVRIA